MAARKNRGTKANPWHETVRDRIRAGMLDKKLLEHVDGKRDLSQTQFAAAKTLLAKVLPDLTQSDVHVGGDITIRIVKFGQD